MSAVLPRVAEDNPHWRESWATAKVHADVVESFLQHFPLPNVLVYIPPTKKKVEAQHLTDFERIRQDLLRSHNCYYTTGVLKDGYTADKKPTKADIAAATIVHLDLDPESLPGFDACPESGPEREEWLDKHWATYHAHQVSEKAKLWDMIQTMEPRPSYCVDSGGGYQLGWFLAEHCADMEAVEARNVGLIQKYSGDITTFNGDRILRIPGTINFPDPRKVAKGRAAVETKLMWMEPARHYRLEDFPVGVVPQKATASVPKATGPITLEDLRQYGIDDRHEVIIVQGHDPDNPKPKDNTPSVWWWQILNKLIKGGADDEVIISVFSNEEWRIGDHGRKKGRGFYDYLIAQIDKAKVKSWSFQYSKDGELLNSVHNWTVALRELGVKLRKNMFTGVEEVDGLRGFEGRIDDDVLIELRMMIRNRWEIYPHKEPFADLLKYRANKRRYHPVRDYLDGLEWDGVERIDRWLIEYAGAEDNEFNRAVGALWLTAAVKRVREPGCKFDEMLVFEQNEGTDKSTALETLAGGPDFFSDGLPLGADPKLTIELTSGKWIIEAAELAGLKSGTKNYHVNKAWLSRRVDTARAAYGRFPIDVKRQFVVAGTTNHAEYLDDPTGNRRFWPVRIVKFDVAALRRDRDQIWAEAQAREASGASIRLDPSLWATAAEAQAERRIDHPWAEAIAAQLPEGDIRVFTEDLWDLLDKPLERRTQADNVLIANVMQQLGFVKAKTNQKKPGETKPKPNYTRGNGPTFRKVTLEDRFTGDSRITVKMVKG